MSKGVLRVLSLVVMSALVLIPTIQVAGVEPKDSTESTDRGPLAVLDLVLEWIGLDRVVNSDAIGAEIDPNGLKIAPAPPAGASTEGGPTCSGECGPDFDPNG